MNPARSLASSRPRTAALATAPLALALLACQPSAHPAPSAPSATLGASGAQQLQPSSRPVSETMVAPTEGTAAVASDATDDEQRAAAAGLNALGFELYAQLRGQPGNVSLAPASVALAFGMVEPGARGATLDELRRVLHSALPTARQTAALSALSARWNGGALGEGLTLRTANRLFGQRGYPFDAGYLALNAARFGAPLELVEFAASEAARTRINTWVAEQTRDRIRDLLPPRSINGETRLVLTNAMYLDAPWARAFPAERTADAGFYVNGAASPTPVPTMRLDASLGYANLDGVHAVELPYRGDALSMVLLVPAARDGLAALEAQLTAPRVQALVDALRPTPVRLSLPRFRVAGASLSLRGALEALGLRAAFSRATADFTGIASPPSADDRLYISDVFHKVFVEVREAGTEAAAATAIVMGRRGGAPAPQAPVVVDADRPFVFVLRDRRNGAALFVGRVTDPRAQ